MSKIILSVYAVLMMGGGFMGYVKAGSKMSLLMGLFSGVVIFAGLYVSRLKPRAGYGLISVMSGLLVLTFLLRLIKTGNFMPAGMLFLLSMIAAVIGIKCFLKVR